MSHSDDGILLAGLDGSNPLAFLAALGTLRTLSLALPDRPVRMRWEQRDGAWRPWIQGVQSQDQVINSIDRQLQKRLGFEAFEIGDNLNLQNESFAEHAERSAASSVNRQRPDRSMADFLAAFGCSACFNEKGITDDTSLRTMSGAGHQHFLKFFRDICDQTAADHLTRALFDEWDYLDPGRGLNLRWDPQDDRRYALRWRNPSNDPNTTMRGANRLAIEALPLLPVMPTGRGGRTTCFTGSGSRDTYFTWPIWKDVLLLDTVRSLLSHTAKLVDWPDHRVPLGVLAIFQSQRITIGKFRNFTPAQAI